jgi:hypothetical protein
MDEVEEVEYVLFGYVGNNTGILADCCYSAERGDLDTTELTRVKALPRLFKISIQAIPLDQAAEAFKYFVYPEGFGVALKRRWQLAPAITLEYALGDFDTADAVRDITGTLCKCNENAGNINVRAVVLYSPVGHARVCVFGMEQAFSWCKCDESWCEQSMWDAMTGMASRVEALL